MIMAPLFTFLDLRGGIRPMKAPSLPTVLCLGNFDGVHLAHIALLAEGNRLAARLSDADHDPTVRAPRKAEVLCGVFCFFNPSMDDMVNTDGRTPTRATHLTTLREKLSLFSAAGISFVCLCHFKDVRHMEPEAFLHLLRRECRCVGAVCGFNFRFGRGAIGRAETISTYFGQDASSVLPELIMDGDTVSATRIRELILQGNTEGATRLLGRPYRLTSTVTHGKKLGRTIGFPTINQFFPAESLIPAHGVYATLCHTPDGVFAGVSNIGTHPTVDRRARINCETHLLDYRGDLYGQRVTVELLKFIRPEQKFSNLAELTSAIRRDAETVRIYLQTHPSLHRNLPPQ